MNPPFSSASAPSPGRAGLPHLWPAVLAVLAATLALTTLNRLTDQRIGRRAAALAALNLPANSRGIALQRRLAALPECLLVYGSSELSAFQLTRADRFFRRHPAGFRPVLIGQAGDRCLLILQELAALGENARGRKFAVFLSPNWFIAPVRPRAQNHLQRQFARDFSPMQAGALLVNGRLDLALKAGIASRLLDNREAVGDAAPLLAGALGTLGGPSPGRAGWFRLEWPLLVLQAAVFRWQDGWQTAHLTIPHGAASRRPGREAGPPPDWTAIMRKLDGALAQRGFSTPYSLDLPVGERPAFLAEADPLHFYPQGDTEFLARVNASKEWTDLGLLLRTIRGIGARVLLVGQPFNGAVFDACHVSAQARRQYYARLGAVAAAHGVELSDFAGCEEDRSFFSDLLHPSAKAWIFYDRALDRFYHAPE